MTTIAERAVQAAVDAGRRRADLEDVTLDGLIVIARSGKQSAIGTLEGVEAEEVAAALLGALMAVCREHDLPLAVGELPTPRGQG